MGNRNTVDGRAAGERDHRVAVAAEEHGVDVFDRDVEFHRDESAEARGVENARLTDDAFRREFRDFEHALGHRVERVADDDNDRVRARFRDLFGDGGDDLRVGGEEVVAAHARFARNAGGNDDDVAVRGVGVIVRAGDVGVVAEKRGGFEQVESFTFRHIAGLRDVQKDDVAQVGHSAVLRGGGADVARSDDADLRSSHVFYSPFSVIFLKLDGRRP